jgi:hypothetical protein
VRIASFPDVLAWTATTERIGDDVFERYASRAYDGLGRSLARARAVNETRAVQTLTAVTGLEPESLERLTLAPETTSRLLRTTPGDGVIEFVDVSLRAELRRAGVAVDDESPCVSALGDYAWDPLGGERRTAPLDGIAVDFESPYADSIDLSGLDRETLPRRPAYSARERERTLRRCSDALALIDATSPEAAWFVRRFTAVLVLAQNPEQPDQFASGSNGMYIGRTFLMNVHREEVETERLVDALIHEAVHALLYMDELETPWLPRALRDARTDVRSPWSGRSLHVRQFLQACFVWYALVEFWAGALVAGTCDQVAAGDFLRRSATGFSASLLPALDPWRDDIAPELFGAVEEMRATVLDALG